MTERIDIRLAWGGKVSPAFRAKVVEIARGFGWSTEHASWLMACMAFETGETFKPDIRNAAGSGATGLIQFMPATARQLGTTVDTLADMTDVQQLDYVQAYFKPYARKIESLSDMYMAILAPRAVGRPDDVALYSHGAAYRMNAGLDKNSDGVITKGEASRFVESALARGLAFGAWYQVTWSEAPTADAATLLARIRADLAALEALLA